MLTIPKPKNKKKTKKKTYHLQGNQWEMENNYCNKFIW